MTLFRPIPSIIGSGLPVALVAMLDPLKQNVEVLTGQRGALGGQFTALLKGSITINPVQNLSTSTGPTGAGFSISGVPVASGEDYIKTVQELQLIRSDMQSIVATLNTLISQLRG